MNQDVVGDTRFTDPVDHRLQAAGVVIALEAGYRAAFAGVDTQLGIVGAAAEGGGHGAAETFSRVPQAGRAAGAAVGVLWIDRGAFSRGSFDGCR